MQYNVFESFNHNYQHHNYMLQQMNITQIFISYLLQYSLTSLRMKQSNIKHLK